MTPAGLKEVEAAKADWRWATAYDSSANATVPPEFVKELARNQAKQFYATLNKANLYSIAYRLQTAKRSETKIKQSALRQIFGRYQQQVYRSTTSNKTYTSLLVRCPDRLPREEC